jgi:hypothetical protein
MRPQPRLRASSPELSPGSLVPPVPLVARPDLRAPFSRMQLALTVGSLSILPS